LRPFAKDLGKQIIKCSQAKQLVLSKGFAMSPRSLSQGRTSFSGTALKDFGLQQNYLQGENYYHLLW
jgi:hypothetical protein